MRPRAVIGIEPQGNCNLPPNLEVKGLAKVPTFSIHGINQVGRPQTGPCLDTYDKIKKAGGDATWSLAAEAAAHRALRPHPAGRHLGQRPHHDVEHQ